MEFDKEMDAILRKERGGGAVSTAATPHLDADMISAFAENAVPERTRALYVEHFADCDRCRRMLSRAVLMNSEMPVATVAAPSVELQIPWYRRLFGMPGLAVAFGALVLAFGGVLIFVALQNRPAAENSTVAKVETDKTPGGPYYSGEEPTTYQNSNSMANAAAAPSAPSSAAANVAANSATTAVNPTVLPTGRASSGNSFATSTADTAGAPADEVASKTSADGKGELKPAAPPPPVVAQPEPRLDENKSETAREKEKDKDDEAALAMRKKSAEVGDRRDLPASPAKSGPSRAGTGAGAGPVNNQSQTMNTQGYDMSVTRRVGGKTFNNRDGAWYDSTYRNQATTNVRRGTDDYKKLDGGLRSIADNLGGVVVVVWKSKAYRIQ